MSNLLNIGISGLHAFQTSLSTVGHNIANSTTDGFSRQRTDLIARSPVFATGNLIGTGVDIGATNRVVDKILTGVHRGNISSEGQLAIEDELANRINTLLAGVDTGISQAISSFYSALQELGNNPASNQQRQVLLSEAEGLVKRVNTLDRRFSEELQGINKQFADLTLEINAIGAGIQKLNFDIVSTGNLGRNTVPNDLLDQRDQLLNKLSKIVEVTSVEQSDGSVDVFIGTGQTLVVGGQLTQLGTQLNQDDPSKLDVIVTNNSGSIVITKNLVGGTYGGLNDVREELILPARAKFNRIILGMGVAINEQHKKGIDALGNLGERFFNDVNFIGAQLSRSLPGGNNVGNGIWQVAIDPIPRDSTGPYSVYGTSSNIVDATTLPTLNIGDLRINGQSIRATVAGDDGVSTTDNAASAIAIAAAINDSTAITNVTATVEKNSLYLGTFTPGAYIAGEFQINGIDVITTGADEQTLITDINALSGATGVKAVGDGNLNITLIADDGRNIQLTSNVNTPVATFTHFDTNSGVALDRVQKASITLIQPNDAITISGANVATAGLVAGTTPVARSYLTDSDYELRFDGTNYRLTRLSDNTILHNSAATNIQVDGMSISLNSGTVANGDVYTIRPTINAAFDFELNIKSLDKLAMALPIRVEANINNHGTGTITRGKVLDTTGQPLGTSTKLGNAFSLANKLTPPIQIQFFNDPDGNTTRYRIYSYENGILGVQIGPEQTFVPNQENEIFPISSVVDTTGPGPNSTYTYDPGYRISIGGEPKEGDFFTVSYNDNGLGDNGNAKELIDIQTENVLSANNGAFQSNYNEMVARVGSLTRAISINLKAANSLTKQSNASIQSVSGVNLDEEAAKILRFQQGYRAAAQVITAGNNLFNILIDSLAR